MEVLEVRAVAYELESACVNVLICGGEPGSLERALQAATILEPGGVSFPQEVPTGEKSKLPPHPGFVGL